ncbi:hypothetical protein, partial [Salmonella sp. s54925]|uniref:hypothetical protein n=1 Tax=Salmonella sp. s54925 TaxID=3159674 RepID=UPI00397F67B7
YNFGYSLNNNVLAYPVLQPDMIDMGQVHEGVTAPTRQTSIPHGVASLDQFLNSDIDYYNIDYDNLDILSGYENEGFSVEDYIDLDKVDVCEQDVINFDVPIKQEKLDKDGMKNLQEME